MSYNIDRVETPVFSAWMYAKDIVKLCKKHGDELPESSFLDEMKEAAVDWCADGKKDEMMVLENFWWTGCSSGNTYDVLKTKIAPFIHGKVEAIFTWEGGDSTSALIIEDGKVYEAEIEQSLKRGKLLNP